MNPLVEKLRGGTLPKSFVNANHETVYWLDTDEMIRLMCDAADEIERLARLSKYWMGCCEVASRDSDRLNKLERYLSAARSSVLSPRLPGITNRILIGLGIDDDFELDASGTTLREAIDKLL